MLIQQKKPCFRDSFHSLGIDYIESQKDPLKNPTASSSSYSPLRGLHPLAERNAWKQDCIGRKGLCDSFQSVCVLEPQFSMEASKVRTEKYIALLTPVSSCLSFTPLFPFFMDVLPPLWYPTHNFLNMFSVSSKELQNRSTVTICPDMKPAYMLQQTARLIMDDLGTDS